MRFARLALLIALVPSSFAAAQPPCIPCETVVVPREEYIVSSGPSRVARVSYADNSEVVETSTAPTQTTVSHEPVVREVVVSPPISVSRPITVLPPPTVYMGRGVLGQRKLYVEGQPLRNSLRWLTP